MPENLTFDHYEVLTREDGSPHELGRGAMGITYKAFDTSLRIPVALKVINGTYLESEIARQRFIREARSAAKLRHRHVASVFHLGIDGNAYFYAMEFIDGETVDALIKREGPLPPVQAMQITDQVARALNAAQPHGLVHRDIKPANLMLIREDDELIVKVIDFGLAKSCLPGEAEEDASTLSVGGFVGTPHFASPEQLAEQQIDVRSDIYSLGVTLWFMLTGQTPFSGSTAQVMSQHLSRIPPYEKLEALPSPVVTLLTLMLQKEAAQRPQSPGQLRQQIALCIKEVGGIPAIGTRPASVSDRNSANHHSTGADRSTQSRVEFEAGATVADHYQVIEKLSETNAGVIWRAKDSRGGQELRLLLLNGDLLNSAEAYTAIEREVDRAVGIEHPNLLKIFALESIERASFIATEWLQGFSLLELLRVRRELQASEVLPFLEQAARGIDQALVSGLKCLDLSLHQIFIHFPNLDQTKEALLRKPLASWPPFVLKLYPLGITRELAVSETWAGAQTLVGGMPAPSAAPEDTRTRYLRELGGVIYELLGGSVSQTGSGSARASRYTPLAALSESGNELLKRAMSAANSFANAAEFATALRSVVGSETSRGTPSSPFPAPSSVATPVASSPPIPVAAKPPAMPIVPAPVPPALPVVPADPSKQTKAPHQSSQSPQFPQFPQFAQSPQRSKRNFSKPVAGAALLSVTLALGAYFGMKGRTGSPNLEERPSKIEEPTPEPSPEPTREPTPEPTPTPPLATPTPRPAPSQQELARNAVREADALEANKDWVGCLQAWLAIAKKFPEADPAKVHLELILDTLRVRSEEVNAREFPALREAITQAAELDVVAAMMFLGDGLRKTEPVASFNWYSAAAARGQVSALRQVGLMLANGVNGTNRDPAKAVYFFQEASDKGDVAAKYLLGECFLHGNGVKKDEKQAVELLSDAADAGNLFAIDLLGTCYHQGLGVEKDPAKALGLFTQASDRGYAVATGNLGVLYIKGDGMAKPDPQKAVELFQKGIRAGDGNCMYFYALCLESGMGVATNRLQAQTWYAKAASAGNKQAADWCRKNAIPFTPLK